MEDITNTTTNAMNNNNNNNNNRPVCVVTGGSKGIGLAIVHRLLSLSLPIVDVDNGDDKPELSFIVYILDRQPPANDDTTCQEEQAMNNNTKNGRRRLIYQSIDISNAKEFTTALKDIAQRHGGRLDCLINNAGYFETEENNNILWDSNTSMEQIDFMLNTNYTSVVHGTREAVQLMRKYHSSLSSSSSSSCFKTIINIASTAALRPFPLHPVYCSTKAAVLQFTQTAQLDLQEEEEGFHIYAICPGIIDTEMGRMGGEINRQNVAKLKGGKRTSPTLVAEAVVGLLLQTNEEWNRSSYLIVNNHEIISVGHKGDE